MHDSGLEERVTHAELGVLLRPNFECLGCTVLYAMLISYTIILDWASWIVICCDFWSVKSV
jgi:hypothetical protein